MNYQISEDEYLCLESLSNQLGLVAALLTTADSELGAITSADLFSFLNARSGEIARVLKATSERHSVQWEQVKQQGVMSSADWMFALRLISGDAAHTPRNAGQSITEKLTIAARIDEDMQRVLVEWNAALQRAGERPMVAMTQATSQPNTRKRSHSAASA